VRVYVQVQHNLDQTRLKIDWFFKVQHFFFTQKKFPLVCSFFSFLSSIFLFSFRGWEFDIIIVSSLSVINFFLRPFVYFVNRLPELP